MRDLSEAFWLIWFEDAEMDPETFSGCGAEDAAKRRYNQLLGNWTCHLMQLASEDATMTREMFEALMALVDLGVDEHNARDTSDGGGAETLRVYALMDEFREKFVVEEQSCRHTTGKCTYPQCECEFG